MEAVYAAAVRAGEGGSVALRAVPLLQVTRAGAVTDTRELTEGELIELLSEGTLRTHRSALHESSCGYRTEKDGSVTVVWYESETKPESTASSTAAEPAMMADSEVQDAILATGGETPAESDAASSEAAAASEEADSTAESEAVSDAEPQAESAASAAA